MNQVILSGRLTREPEIKTSESGKKFGRYGLAVDRNYKRDGEPTADFFECTVFDRRAEFAEKYLHKGMKIIITGELRNNNYTNAETGKTVYRNDIIVNNHEFCESKKASEGAVAAAAAPAPAAAEKDDGFMNIPDGLEEELPFN